MASHIQLSHAQPVRPREQSVHRRHLDLVQAIEAKFEVERWRSGDVDLWPPARADLFLDMFRMSGGDTAPARPPFIRRAAHGLVTPFADAWKRRSDLAHWRPWPARADAIFLGDGVSLDKISGAWRDRHGEPVMAALARLGRTTFLMQPGALDRLPWARPTFAANTIAARGALSAALARGTPADLPDHTSVLEFLASRTVQATSFARAALAKRGRTIAATASAFQRVLRTVRPHLAFVVTYYAGLGHAFALACRREGIMCIDLQHCPHEGEHRAYRWHAVPAEGYSTLPAVFWTWNADDVARVAASAGGSPWHKAVHGGHSQLAPYLEEPEAAMRPWRQRFEGYAVFERDILVALQPIGGRRTVWEALARQIAAAPPSWRWWIRRHPAASAVQDIEHQGLLALTQPNVVIEAASELPLPALLARMSAIVSLASGAAAEAAVFGVPALFLDSEAFDTFPGLLARGEAQVVDVAELISRIAALPARPECAAPAPPPDLATTLARLKEMAAAYRDLCQAHPMGGRSNH